MTKRENNNNNGGNKRRNYSNNDRISYTPEQSLELMKKTGELVFIENRGGSEIWKKTEFERKAINSAKSHHKAMLTSMGLNPKKHMNY